MENIMTPDGNYKPVRTAVAEWNELFAPMEAIGFEVHAFDPGVQFKCPDTGKIVDMPVKALRRINDNLKSKYIH